MRTKALRAYRVEIFKLNQEDMAAKLDLQPSHYNMIENANRGISLNLFGRIWNIVNKATGKTMEEVFFDLKSHEATTEKNKESKISLTNRQKAIYRKTQGKRVS